MRAGALLSILWARWRTPLERIIDWLPFTFGGSVFLVASASATWYFGIQRSDLVLIILGSVGIALSLAGCLLTWFAGIWMHWRFRQLPACTMMMTVQGQHRLRTEIRLPWWIPLIQVSWIWENASFEMTLDGEHEIVMPLRRGYCQLIRREILVGDAFGICEVTIRSQQPASIQVVPQSMTSLMPEILQGLRQGGKLAHPMGRPTGDRIDIRNYAVGDPVRYILWKVYARTGELVVRTPERAFEPDQRLLAYLIAHPEDAISASLAAEVLRHQQLGETWAFGVDGHPDSCTEIEAALEAITQSGDSEVQNAEGLASFVHQQSDAASLLVFAPATTGAWVDEVLSIATQVPTQVMIAGVLPAKRGFVQTMLFDPVVDTVRGQFDMETLDDVSARLERGGVQVRLVSPSMGMAMTPRDLRHHWEQRAS